MANLENLLRIVLNQNHETWEDVEAILARGSLTSRLIGRDDLAKTEESTGLSGIVAYTKNNIYFSHMDGKLAKMQSAPRNPDYFSLGDKPGFSLPINTDFLKDFGDQRQVKRTYNAIVRQIIFPRRLPTIGDLHQYFWEKAKKGEAIELNNFGMKSYNLVRQAYQAIGSELPEALRYKANAIFLKP